MRRSQDLASIQLFLLCQLVVSNSWVVAENQGYCIGFETCQEFLNPRSALMLFLAPPHQAFADKAKAALAATQTLLQANPAASKADIAKADAEAKVRPRALVRFGPMNRTQSRVATHPFINTRH